MEDLSKPLWQLTIGEFVELLDSKIPSTKTEEADSETLNKNYVYGLAGLAKILGCSKNHASKLKSTGMRPSSKMAERLSLTQRRY